MVTGGVVGGASAAPSGRGMLRDTTLVARPLGAGRSACCAASAPELHTEKATIRTGAQRMAAPWARVVDKKSVRAGGPAEEDNKPQPMRAERTALPAYPDSSFIGYQCI